MAPELLDGRSGQINPPSLAVILKRRQLEAISILDFSSVLSELALYRDRPGLEIDVAPHEPQKFTLAASAGDGHPQRTAQQITTSRLKLILAVLEQRAGVCLSDQDVFVSVAGGVRCDDPGSDLGFALALYSARNDRALGDDLVACAEIGLAGELRCPGRIEHRLQEAFRLGFRRAIVPPSAPPGPTGLETLRCETLDQAIAAAEVGRPLAPAALG